MVPEFSSVQVAPPSADMISTGPAAWSAVPTAPHWASPPLPGAQEMLPSMYVPCPRWGGPAGRFAKVVHVAPPSVVSAAAGLYELSELMPATQQTDAETQSMEFGHQVAPAPVQVSGIRKV